MLRGKGKDIAQVRIQR